VLHLVQMVALSGVRLVPSVSKKQHNFMEAIAHSPSFAKKVGVKQSVGKEFAAADKGKNLRRVVWLSQRKWLRKKLSS